MTNTEESPLGFYFKGLIQGFCFSLKNYMGSKFTMEPDSGTAQTIAQKLTYEFPDGTQLLVRFDLLPPGNWEICADCGGVLYNDRTDKEVDPVWLAAVNDGWICPATEKPHRSEGS